MTKWIYDFGDGRAEGHAGLRELLGGKGANLAEMSNLGIAVPGGFTITTEVCTYYYDNQQTYPDDLQDQVRQSMAQIEAVMGARFGDPDNPLLISVRSGARASMPGMMDTVLNLGLNDDTAAGLARKSGDERFAYDSYRRFIQIFADVVLGVDAHSFESLLEQHKDKIGVTLDTQLSAEDWKSLVEAYKALVAEETGKPFPMDPFTQLWGAIGAVFDSWMIPRAVTYRELHRIPADWGTAVNVQAMVFGNMGDDCCTGVCFTRDPSTGDNIFYGEFLINAQGEDVVAGIRTPQPLNLAKDGGSSEGLPSMEEEMPEIYAQLCAVREHLETHYRDMQDMEFTVQSGKLWMLQTRNGKRTAAAAVKIATDMCEEGLISKEEAILRMDPAQIDGLLHPMLDPDAARTVIAKGLPASPGAASGKVVFTAEDAVAWTDKNIEVLLVRIETSPDDISGMHVAQGILTTRGGMTSHAAVVARGMGTPCVSGAGDIEVDDSAKCFRVGKTVVSEGDTITIDGTSGEVMLGAVATLQPEPGDAFLKLMSWVDEARELKVRTNAETPLDASTARKFGAEGIGLCRTEHMFFERTRIVHMREMILAPDEQARRAALAKLLPYQRQDFVELFEIMSGLPVTVRLLDPPLHEFLPHTEAECAEVAKAIGATAETVKAAVTSLSESNPMLGHRGCRLGMTYPEIYEMQTRAIFEAACEVSAKGDTPMVPEVMVPLVSIVSEFETLKSLIDATAEAVMKERGLNLRYKVGVMIELPRAALLAGDIATKAEFFSFGTNDLTQTTYGLSRDDAGRILTAYLDDGVIGVDPFASLDQEGVGQLVRMAAERGQKTRPDLHLGLCGEHGGDPSSVVFCHDLGLTYVSCSPYRVPIARLAAAQAALRDAADTEIPSTN